MLKNPLEKVKLFDHPGKTVLFFALLTAGFYTLQCTLFQNILGLDVLETITWGAQGVMGHTKHPPLSGWIGYAVSKICGHHDFGMYLAAQLCLAGGVIFVYRTARLFLDPYRSGTAALLLYFLFYYNPSETKFCTYPLEMLLVPGTVYFFFKALQSGKRFHWAASGIFAGLGILNKYSCGLFLIALAVIFFINKDYRRTLKTSGPYLAVLACLCVIAPHLEWLYWNDFICFKHVSSRLEDDHKWYQVFVTLGTALYPFAMVAAVMFAAWFPDRKKHGSVPGQRKLFRNMMILSIIPPAVVTVLSALGHGVIMMWFCSMAAFTGIAAAAVFPKEADKVFFKRICLLLSVFCVVMFTVTTVYLIVSSGPRLHSKPQDFAVPSAEMWQKNRPGTDIPVVIGPRYYACVLENYLPYRPPACELGDPLAMKMHRRTVREKGALLIGKKPAEFEQFFTENGIDPASVKFEKIIYRYSAPWGRTRQRAYYLGILQPME